MGKTVINQARKPRNCLSLKEKCRAIDILKENKSEQFIATLYELSKSQIHRLSVNKENVQKCFDDNVFVELKKKTSESVSQSRLRRRSSHVVQRDEKPNFKVQSIVTFSCSHSSPCCSRSQIERDF